MLLCAVCHAESNMEGIFGAFLLKYKLHETKHNFQPREPFQEASPINKDNLPKKGRVGGVASCPNVIYELTNKRSSP